MVLINSLYWNYPYSWSIIENYLRITIKHKESPQMCRGTIPGGVRCLSRVTKPLLWIIGLPWKFSAVTHPACPATFDFLTRACNLFDLFFSIIIYTVLILFIFTVPPWKVIRSWDNSAKACLSYPTNRSNIAPGRTICRACELFCQLLSNWEYSGMCNCHCV